MAEFVALEQARVSSPFMLGMRYAQTLNIDTETAGKYHRATASLVERSPERPDTSFVRNVLRGLREGFYLRANQENDDGKNKHSG